MMLCTEEKGHHRHQAPVPARFPSIHPAIDQSARPTPEPNPARTDPFFTYPTTFPSDNPFHLSTDTIPQEPSGLTARLDRVRQMRRGDDERAGADGIANIAEDLGTLTGVIGDGAAVLEVLGVSEEGDALDLLLDGAAELADGGGDERRALAVPAGDDGRVGTLLVGQREQPLALVDVGLRGAPRQEVGGQRGVVRAADALDPDIPDGGLKAVGESGADGDALLDGLVSWLMEGTEERRDGRTMLPGSVEPRAKIRMASGQALALPRSRPFSMAPSCRATSSGAAGVWFESTGAGRAATRLAVLRMAKNFMLATLLVEEGWCKLWLRTEAGSVCDQIGPCVKKKSVEWMKKAGLMMLCSQRWMDADAGDADADEREEEEWSSRWSFLYTIFDGV
jgi:hypothetical protein